jgi:hypothetical protein
MFCHFEIYIPTVHTKTKNTSANNVYDISSSYIQVLFKNKNKEKREIHIEIDNRQRSSYKPKQ